jgi:hypothetical protein
MSSPALTASFRLPAHSAPSCVCPAPHLSLLFVGNTNGGVVALHAPAWLSAEAGPGVSAVPDRPLWEGPVAAIARGVVYKTFVAHVAATPGSSDVHVSGQNGQVVRLRVIPAEEHVGPAVAAQMSHSVVWVHGDPGDPGGWSEPNHARVLAVVDGEAPALDSAGASADAGGGGGGGGGGGAGAGAAAGDSLAPIILQRVGILRVAVATCIQRALVSPTTGLVTGVLGWMGNDLLLADVTPTAGMQLLRVACASRLSAHDVYLRQDSDGGS